MNALHPITTSRTVLRLAEVADASRLLRYREQNREHLAPWEPLRDEAYYTLDHCVQTLAESREAMRLDRAYPFYALDLSGKEILATFTFANVVRGAFQACHLGYSIALRRQGQGVMQEVLEAALPWAFLELDMHRVMANYMPRNERSGRLLERLGFEREGYAKRYLQIAGAWEDHVLTSRIRHP
ncbi:MULTISPECIES: ribosomal protein S5-alanine N-acetyltransferase [Dyella]|uniref:ribosomal protein S5-alanine N-acetyltransferase n=1 Tax=Dyella TaxID=231454 RepID=UPI000C852B13|nr:MULTISPECIES: ribosomal protein S5-alanine N-acetyltransferase [Dyella]MDR3444535.1 ribosomal protein S5-alanine N-acetyltransferase [Dyella sp.]PMQ05593.1 putative ribosomal N-acetyltransferase YdaF [Dyella sp. AD56]ULU24817.1 ribosomal protein S5-alanine N-acetyltransferase [Dyella terrae]